MKRALILFIILFSFLRLAAQDFSSLKWLEGDWEGVGYVGKVGRTETISFTYNKKIETIVIGSILNEKIELTSEYTHIDRSMEILTVYFLGDGSNADNRELIISRISEDHVNLSLVYNRYPLNRKLILHGAFKKKVTSK